IRSEFRYRYLVLRGDDGRVCAIQPYLIVDQDLVAGAGRALKKAVGFVRRVWPRFLSMRTLMMGCAAGEGHLDGRGTGARERCAALLADGLVRQGRAEGAQLIVLKEFPAAYRRSLDVLRQTGFARLPSLPMTTLDLGFEDF